MQLYENSPFQLAAQNICVGRGQYTGEVSAEILLDLGVSYVLCGHSDHRILYWESNTNVAKKVSHALAKGLRVIACGKRDAACAVPNPLRSSARRAS